MTYSVKEIFYTLQGEGANAGRPAVFCRFSGCNLWSGREEDRERATCKFCDTEFVGVDGTGGGRYLTAGDLTNEIVKLWPQRDSKERFVVLTGGEPLLQVDNNLINALHNEGFYIAVESNGTIEAPQGIDWLCVSPKADAPWIQRQGQELKVVWPQPGLDLDELESGKFTHHFLQPLDSALQTANTHTCIQLCMERPKWRLSIQTHKMMGIR